MTKKRFIKLAMSYGWDRNGANYLAKQCSEYSIPYELGATPLPGHTIRGMEGIIRYFFRLKYSVNTDGTNSIEKQ